MIEFFFFLRRRWMIDWSQSNRSRLKRGAGPRKPKCACLPPTLTRSRRVFFLRPSPTPLAASAPSAISPAPIFERTAPSLPPSLLRPIDRFCPPARPYKSRHRTAADRPHSTLLPPPVRVVVSRRAWRGRAGKARRGGGWGIVGAPGDGEAVRAGVPAGGSEQEHGVVHVPGRVDDLHPHPLLLLAPRALRLRLHTRHRVDRRQPLPLRGNRLSLPRYLPSFPRHCRHMCLRVPVCC
jgi:hypothetical protein